MVSNRCLRGAAALALLSSLVACGGGGGGGRGNGGDPPDTPPATRTIGGAVSGLAGSGLVLQNNGGDNLAIAANGAFTFNTSITAGNPYAVTVLSQPTGPAQSCVVGSGSGTASSSNVTAVTVTCTTNTFSVGVTVSGLTGGGLVLSNGSDRVTVNANGAFTFDTAVADGARYSVLVAGAPSDPVQRCNVTDGFGTVTNANVNVGVACVATFPTFAYSINQGDGTFSSHAIDATTGQLRARFNAKTGTLPLNAVTYKSGNGKQFSYIVNQGSDTVSAFALDPRSGALDEVAGSPFATGGDAPGAAVLHPTRPFLYAPNANGTTVAAFAIDATSGVLTSAGAVAAGSKPQAFQIEATGRFAYAAAPDSSELYTYTIDQATGALTEVANSRVAIGTALGGMTLERNGRYLYLFNPTPGTISAFAIDASTGVLTALTGSPFSAGANAAFAAMHPNGRFIYVKHSVPTQTSASGLTVFAIDASSGALSEIAGSPFDTGANPIATSFDSTGRYLFAGHLLVSGAPEFNVRAYTVDATTGALSDIAGSPFATGSYPSAVAVDPSRKYLYVTNQLSNQLTAYRIENGSGELTQLQGAPANAGSTPTFISVAEDTTPLQLQSKFVYVLDLIGNTVRSFTIDADGMLSPGATPLTLANSPSSITLDPKNHYAYVTNFTDDTVGIYSVAAATGALTEIAGSPVPIGNSPRSLVIEPTGRYAYVASMAANSIEKLTIDPATGALSSPVSINVGQAVNMLKIAPNGKWLLATTSSDSFVYSYPIDTVTGELDTAAATFIDTTGTVDSIAVDASGKVAYVTDAANATLRTYSINSQDGTLSGLGSEFSNFPVGAFPDGVAADPRGGFAFTADGANNTVSVFRLAANGALSSYRPPVPAGTNPIAVAVDYSGKFVCVVTGAGQLLSFALDRDATTLVPIDSDVVTGVSTSSALTLSIHAE